MSENTESRGSTRREFLRSAAVAATAAAVAAPAKSAVYSLAPQRVIGANDRIIIGVVGVGGQGYTHLRLLDENATENNKNNTQTVAVCDIYRRRLNKARTDFKVSESQAFEDYRKLLENKDIDAVWIATSDNWHAPIAIDAMKAGKHVYVEKPLCRTLKETFEIYDTAKATNRLLQVGSQGCSDAKWHTAGKVVKEGRIGHVIMAQGSYTRNGRDGEWNYYGIDKDASPTASGDGYVNWEVFRRGQGPKDWDPDRYFRWRKYWAYGNGIMGDLFPHRLHPLMIAMALPLEGLKGYPLRASSLGGIYVQKVNPETGKPDREVPDFTNICVDFPGDDGQPASSMMLLGSTINEQGWQDMIRGNKATLFFGGSGVDIRPERVWADEIEGGTEPVEGPGEDIAVHHKNFLDAVRGQGQLNAGIELAARVQTMICLGEMAYRQGKTMHFDPKTRKAWG